MSKSNGKSSVVTFASITRELRDLRKDVTKLFAIVMDLQEQVIEMAGDIEVLKLENKIKRRARK